MAERLHVVPWVIEQRLDELVFVAVGCLHQVVNGRGCTKAASAFIATASVPETLKMGELRGKAAVAERAQAAEALLETAMEEGRDSDEFAAAHEDFLDPATCDFYDKLGPALCATFALIRALLASGDKRAAPVQAELSRLLTPRTPRSAFPPMPRPPELPPAAAVEWAEHVVKALAAPVAELMRDGVAGIEEGAHKVRHPLAAYARTPNRALTANSPARRPPRSLD